MLRAKFNLLIQKLLHILHAHLSLELKLFTRNILCFLIIFHARTFTSATYLFDEVLLFSEETCDTVVLLLFLDLRDILLVKLVDSDLQHFHLLNKAISLFIQLLHNKLLFFHCVAQVAENLLFQKDRVSLNKVGLI
jgi:hypothetical protein